MKYLRQISKKKLLKCLSEHSYELQGKMVIDKLHLIEKIESGELDMTKDHRIGKVEKNERLDSI